jgi:4-amino-4-deoxychorismate lyase
MILVDGRIEDRIPAGDRGFQYGDGVFETIAVVDGHALCLDAHLHRLCTGCDTLAIPTPDVDTLIGEVRQIMDGASRAVLKVIVTRGTGDRGYAPPATPAPMRVVSIHAWPDHPGTWRTQGVDAALCEFTLARQPALAGIKHLNRLEQVLARAETVRRACQEGIVSDGNGAVIGGTMSNLFLRRANALVTPDLSDCGVAGIIRGEILRRATALGVEIHVQPLRRADVLAADEIFFTNSVIGIWPVRRAGEHRYRTVEVANRIARALVDAGCIAPP